MSLATRSVRGAMFLSVSTISNILIGFVGGIMLARLLAPNDFGTFGLATTLIAFVDIRNKLQLEQKYLREQDTSPEHFNTFFTLNMILAGISFLLLLLPAIGAALLARVDLALCIVFIGLVSLLDPVSVAIRLSIEKEVAFGRVAIIQSTTSLTQFASTLIAAVAGLQLWSLPLGYAIGTVLNFILFARIAPRRPALRFNRGLAREFMAYGLKYGVVWAGSSVVLTQADNLAVGLLGGTAALGFYDRAYRTSLWPTLLISAALGRISLPTYSKLQDDVPRLGKAFSFVLWTVLTLTTPIALLFLVTAPELVPVIYGEKWLPSVPILQVLAAFAMFRPLWDDLTSVLIATKRPGQMARLAFIQAVVMIVLILPLTWLLGGLGAAISVGLAFMISAGFLLYFGRVHLKINLMDAAGRPLINNLLTLLGYWLLRGLLPFDTLTPLLRLIGEAGLMLGLYAVIGLIFSGRIIRQRLQYIYQLARGQ
ncbi:MAG: oligosaccharide flippase family protein [Chloroflexi bacterium]|nr:oligosaccharide flippase family protein [Chloroflexota bacterium]